MLCTHKTASSASLVLEICPPFNNSYLTQFSSIFDGNHIRLTVSSFDSQANQSNQSSHQRELLMPSPQVIDLTLSDDNEIQPDPIRSDQRTPTHTQATNLVHFCWELYQISKSHRSTPKLSSRIKAHINENF